MSHFTLPAPTPNTPLVRTLLDRLFNKNPVRVPALHETTTWLGVRHAFTHPPTREDFFTPAALNYVCAVALFYQGGDAQQRPACTLAHVAATVSLVAPKVVLTALATCPEAARLVQPLLDAHSTGAHGQVAGIIPGAHALVADLTNQVNTATRARVQAYFSSIS